MNTEWPNKVTGANRRWRLQFRCRASRHKSAVAHLFSLGHMNWRTAIITLSLVIMPSVAFGDPSPMAGPYAPFIGLFAEAVIIAVILGSKGFDPIRFFYSWGVFTLATFGLLVGAFFLFDWVDERFQIIPFGLGIVLFVVAEAAIVCIEAVVLFRMTRMSFFQRKEAKPLVFGQALTYSIIVNLVSFCFSL